VTAGADAPQGNPTGDHVTLLACASPDCIAALESSAAMNAFRPGREQQRALVEIAADDRCCVTVAAAGERLVGYVAFHPPTEVETWGEDRTGRIVELGAVEVHPEWRGALLAQRLLRASFESGRFEETVVFAAMYVWHYDLKRSGLSDFAYRRMLERLYASVGMERMPTSDPEVRSNAANALMVRFGSRCPSEVRAEFERLRTRPHPLRLY
jgi:acetoin utilization protein AcuA